MKLNLNIPTGWNQLSEKQLLLISELMLNQNSEIELQTKALALFCNITILEVSGDIIYVRVGRKFYTLYTWQIDAAKEKLAWITTDVYDVQPLKKLCGKKPVDKWMQATLFVQYLAAENYYQAFLYTKQPMHLARLAAVLYPPKGEYNDKAALKNSNRFMLASAIKLNCVFLWYTSIKKVLASKFPHLFITVKNMEEDWEENTPLDMRKMIDNMLYSLNGGDVTKDKDIFKTDTWRALAVLDKKAQEYQELIKLNKKH